MIKLTQRGLHDPENGRYGECFRTALGCVLGNRGEVVWDPHPGELHVAELSLHQNVT
jgi:hypothetical protein